MKHWLKFAVSFYMLEIFQVFYEVFPISRLLITGYEANSGEYISYCILKERRKSNTLGA